jgi:hypothetical protein
VDGSGRQAGEYSRKTTSELPSLDVRELKRADLIDPRQELVEGVAYLAWTPCNFGSSRPWFVCPGEGCGRRVAILYGPGSGQLLCRHCCNLAYASQSEGQIDRAKRRAEKAHSRLPRSDARPKGMHHATFIKRTRDYLEALEEHEAVVQERLARLEWHRAARRA